MTAFPPIPPAPTEARKTTPGEIADVTGWDVKVVRDAIQAGALPGCRYVPTRAGTARFLCAWAPFINWFSGGVETAPAPQDETVKLLHRIEALDTVRQLIDKEVA